MKKALFMIAAAATFIFAGCQKEQGAQQIAAESKDIIHINIEQMAPATKVAANDITADPLTFKWEEGDSVAFWEITNKVKTYSCTDPEEGIFESTDGAVLDPSTSYTAVYPADYDFNGAMQATLSNTVHTTFSTYRGNALPREHLILAQSVQGNATSFTLDAHSSVLHFKLKGNANIGSIEYMAGNDSEASTILSCGEGIQLSGEPTDFYLDAIHTNGSGFKLVFKDPDDTVLGEKTSSSNLTLQIGKMVDFTEVVTVNAAYSITGNVTPTSSGTVTFKKNGGSTGITQAYYGDEITVEATPNTGYTLKSITWAPDGGSDTDITSAKTFTMPAKNVTVTATFEEPLTGEINGRAYVKMGGKKWATTNIGATNPQDYGDLYSWGETATKADYSSSQYKASSISSDISPTSGYDVARVNWGSSWRMPTKDDFIALDKACGGNGNNTQSLISITSSHTVDGKVKKGRYWLAANQKVLSGIDELKNITAAGMLYSDGENYLFFPAAGASFGTSSSGGGSEGYYWSSTWDSSTYAYGLGFSSSNVYPQYNGFRYIGFSVRPVSD